MTINVSNTRFENIDTKKISEKDLLKIHEIEQDMWAEWIWEYLKCDWCWEIYSKNDIYWTLPWDIYVESVAKLEQISWIDITECKCCWDNVCHIWWKDYINDIQERYSDNESFLTIIRNQVWDIVWFTDAYISDLDTIYRREFEHYYNEIWLDKIKDMIKNILNWEIPREILMHSTTGIESKYSNIGLFLNLIYELYKNIYNIWYIDILGLYEASVWSTAHSLYYSVWAERIWINNWNIDSNYKLKNTHKESTSDIFVHKNIVTSAVNNFWLPVKIFMKKNSKKIREVLCR